MEGVLYMGSVSLSVSGFLRMRPTAIKTLAKISYFSVRASFSRTFSSGWFPFPAAFLQDRPQESQPGFQARPHAVRLSWPCRKGWRRLSLPALKGSSPATRPGTAIYPVPSMAEPGHRPPCPWLSYPLEGGRILHLAVRRASW